MYSNLKFSETHDPERTDNRIEDGDWQAKKSRRLHPAKSVPGTNRIDKLLKCETRRDLPLFRFHLQEMQYL